MRITVLGLPGSGKTRFAASIAKSLQIPHIQLDHFWFEGGGGHNSRTTPDPERAHAHVISRAAEAIAQDSWVSDGVYGWIQPQIIAKADLVVYLDLPLWRRLLNHAKRLVFRSNRHHEMTFWRDLSFFKEMLGRNAHRRDRLAALIATSGKPVTVLKTHAQANDYLSQLTAASGGATI